MSVHREAVEDGINPIWFQKQCRYTFSLSYAREKHGRELQVDFGTNSDAHRSAWLKALNAGIRGGGPNGEDNRMGKMQDEAEQLVVVDHVGNAHGASFYEEAGVDGIGGGFEIRDKHRPRRASNTVAPSPVHRRIGSGPTARA